MKSVFLSILMFILVFTALKLNILRLFDGHILFYISICSIIIAFICGVYYVGVPKFSDFNKFPQKKPEDKDD